MSFLAPLFLLGALAIALPIVFHLIRQTSRDRVPFSSLMFLQPTPPRVTRRSRLENIFLLILRCLVLALLALGFARPLLQKPIAADASTAQGERLVVLLDGSASMRRDGLWPAARAKAIEWLRKAAPADAAALLWFDRTPRSLITFAQWREISAADRVALAARQVEATEPGWGSTHLGNALLAAVELLEERSTRTASEQRNVARRIVLITDLQQGVRLDGLQGYEWPQGVEVVVETLKPRQAGNAGLQWITDREDASGTADAPGRVRISNSTDARQEQFRLSWARQGDSGLLGQPVEAYVPPGQSRVIAAPGMPTNGPADRLMLLGDREPFDNAAWFVPPRPEQLRILFLGSDRPGDPTRLMFYLQRAFQETRRQVPRVVWPETNRLLTASDWSEATLAIIAEPLTEADVAAARGFLDAGKTVLAVMQTPALAPVLSRVANLGALPAEEASVRQYALFGQVDFAHPIFAPFADARFSDFTRIHFWKHRRVDVSAINDARVLARFDDGDPALVQLPAGRGTLLLLTSGWHPADSQMALSSKFVPLLYSILELSGGFKAQAAQYFVGDTIPLPTTNASPWQVRKPDGREVRVTLGNPFGETDQAGIYTVAQAQPSLRFAVNVDASESLTAPLPVEELERLRVPLKPQSVEAGKVEQRQRERLQAAELENRQKLWRWLLVAAVVMLLFETLVAGWMTRRSKAAPAAA